MHRLGQGGIEQAVMPDRGVAGRVARLEARHRRRAGDSLAELLEGQGALPFVGSARGKRGARGQHGHQPVAEGLGVLKIVGLQKLSARS